MDWAKVGDAVRVVKTSKFSVYARADEIRTFEPLTIPDDSPEYVKLAYSAINDRSDLCDLVRRAPYDVADESKVEPLRFPFNFDSEIESLGFTLLASLIIDHDYPNKAIIQSELNKLKRPKTLDDVLTFGCLSTYLSCGTRALDANYFLSVTPSDVAKNFEIPTERDAKVDNLPGVYTVEPSRAFPFCSSFNPQITHATKKQRCIPSPFA